jgi:hypothetical protein
MGGHGKALTQSNVSTVATHIGSSFVGILDDFEQVIIVLWSP